MAQNTVHLAGLTYTQLDNHIHFFYLRDAKRDTVTAWSQLFKEVSEQAAQRQEHLRTLHQFETMWFTPHAMQHIVAFNYTTPINLVVSNAIVVVDNVAAVFAQMVLRQQHFPTNQLQRIFISEAEALLWLDERLQSSVRG